MAGSDPGRALLNCRVVAVTRRFGIPAVHHQDLPEVAGRHGAPLPVDLRPPTPRCHLAAAECHRTGDGRVVVVPRGRPC